MLRSILAVVAGYAIWTVIWLAGGVAMMAVFQDQPTEDGRVDGPVLFLVSLALSAVCSLAGGALCARITGNRSKTPPGVLAGLLLLTGLGVQISGWDAMPVWYHVPFQILLVPVTLLGARLAAPKTN